MNFVPMNPVEAVLAEVLAAVVHPAWIVDADRGLLVAGNGRGHAVWGVPVMTLALDSATIPVLKALRGRLAGRAATRGSLVAANAAAREPLRFWTCGGIRTVPCTVHLLDDSVGRALLLVVMEEGAQTAHAPAGDEGQFDERAFVERWLAMAGGGGRSMPGAGLRPPAAATGGVSVPLSDAETLREIARRIRQGAAGMVADGDVEDDTGAASAEAQPPHRSARPVELQGAAKVSGGVTAGVDVSVHLAHEIRTPLAAIISLAEVITEERLGPWPNERYRAYVRDILDSARHGLDVVDGILREVPGEQTPPPVAADVDLNVEVEALCASLQPLADKSGARLEAALVSGLPRVAADRRNVRQMLLNLISNAIKHGGKAVRIKVTTGYELGGDVWVEVEDDGPGMVPHGAAAERGAVVEGRPRKAGLGLPLTRSLAVANGARLDLSSKPGRGVRARIVFAADGPPTRR